MKRRLKDACLIGGLLLRTIVMLTYLGAGTYGIWFGRSYVAVGIGLLLIYVAPKVLEL